MRIARLELRRFGPFTDEALDLSEGTFGLHVIFGSNEAGKSSALRAVTQLLYGIPQQSSDNFLHPYQRLRIGAVLVSASGERLECVRRKGRVGTLRAADDDEVIPDERLLALLGGIDRETFIHQFGISHEELKSGGKAIVCGGGEAGQILFAAGAGLSGLRRIQAEFVQEAEQLFKPRGSVPQINKAIVQLRDLRRQVKEKQLRADEWRGHDRALREAVKREREIHTQLRTLDTEVGRLERILKALPEIGRRDSAIAALTRLIDVPLLAAEFDERHRKASEQLTGSLATERERARGLEGIEKEIDALVVPRPLLEHAGAIQQLSDNLAVHRNARGNRGKLVGELDRLEGEIGRSRERLGRRPEGEEGKPSAVAELGRLVRRIEKRGDMEGRLETAGKALDRAREQALVDLDRLSLWSGRLQDLERLAIPAAETIDRFDGDLRRADDRLVRLRDRREDLQEKLGGLDRDIEELERRHDVPTEADLTEARERRGEGWRLVLRAWHGDGGVKAEEIESFIETFAPGGDLPVAFEASVQAADEVADRLRREADRVARKVQLLSDREASRATLQEIEKKIEDAEKSRSELIREWEAVWQPIGIEPLTPREMQGWLKRCNELAHGVREIREQASEIAALEDELGACKRELGAALVQVGEPAGPESELLAAKLDRAHVVIDTIGELETKQREAAEFRRRVAAIDEDGRTFAAEVARLVELVAPDLADLPAERAAAELGERLSQAERLQSQSETLIRQRDDLREKRNKARDSVERARAELEQLCREAGCATADELPELVRRSEERRKAEEKRELSEARLTDLAAAKRLEDFITECRGMDADETGALIRERKREIEGLTGELAEVQQAIGAERTKLDGMDGGADAAELQEQAEQLLARIQADAEQYTRLCMASAVLRLAVERFRERSQDPVLERAGEHFAALTRGSFAGLRPDFDDSEKAIVTGVRPGGEALSVDAMSDGTADQLYLALRLAMLERHLERHQPIPLLIDDILVAFDDQRALAALEILARLSERTQVIFFTHHQHMVDLARENVEPGRVFVHSLGQGGGDAARRNSTETSQRGARP